PRSFLKKKLRAIFIQLGQKEWDNDGTGRDVHLILPKVNTSPAPWHRPEIMFVTGHGTFPTLRIWPQNHQLLCLWRVGKLFPLLNQLPPYKLMQFYQALKRS
ncbi:hypothetical protein AVEN_205241-1, partial [Araneus ventricosus]